MKCLLVLLRFAFLIHHCVATEEEIEVKPTATAVFISDGQGNGRGAPAPSAASPCSSCSSSTCINCCTLANSINDVCPNLGVGLCTILDSQFTTVCSTGDVRICVCPPAAQPRSNIISYSVVESSTPSAVLATPAALLSDAMQTMATPDPSHMF